MMYEGGWGKKLSYVISCSCFEIVDVTRRYTAKWCELLQRRLEVPEEWLLRTLQQINAQIQFQMMLPDYLAREHESRRAAELQQLQQLHPQVGAARRALAQTACHRFEPFFRCAGIDCRAGCSGRTAAATERFVGVADVEGRDGREAVTGERRVFAVLCARVLMGKSRVKPHRN